MLDTHEGSALFTDDDTKDSPASLKEALAEARQRMEFEARLIGMVGHELRTPLGAIAAGIELLHMEPGLSSRGREALARLERSATHMTTIIHRLLDVTKQRDTGAFAVVRRPCDVCAVVEEHVDELRTSNPGRVINASNSGEASGEYDAAALGQVVVNLVSNALTHGAPDTPVEIATTSSPSAVTISVTNQGKPIPAGVHASLFEPFTGEMAGRGRGLGLGLYIAKGIADAHGGQISVRSEPDATTFRLMLPRS